MVVKTIKKITAAILGYIKQTDKILIALCLVASFFSLTLLLAMDNSFDSGKRDILVQGASLFIGMVCAFILSKVDYHTWVGLWKLYVPAALFIVLLTFITATRPTPRWMTKHGCSLKSVLSACRFSRRNFENRLYYDLFPAPFARARAHQ